ncbi:hypothetical protein [Flavobacterium beibuense]|uniref:hypothetical protein n=1 Tax=Flavobacterium beibuense TaxID=657326 RepID=UPI003A9036BA
MEQPIKTVAKISDEVAAQIVGKEATGTSYKFNPVPDADGNNIISLGMAQYLDAGQYEVIAFKPIIEEEV